MPKRKSTKGIERDSEPMAVETSSFSEQKSVYFIHFPKDSPVFSLIPEQFELAGVYQDIQEAMVGLANRAEAIGLKEAQESVEDETGLILINGVEYYRRRPKGDKDQDAVFLGSLVALREVCVSLGICLLLPEDKIGDQELRIDLMCKGLYNYWFLTAMNAHILQEVLETRRDFRAMEAYLATLPLPAAVGKAEEKDGLLFPFFRSASASGSQLKRLFDGSGIAGVKNGDIEDQDSPGRIDSLAGIELSTPVRTIRTMGSEITDFWKRQFGQGGGITAEGVSPLPQSSTLLFDSQEDYLLPYALAFLTAVHFAVSGRKTLLVELPGSGSRLSTILGLRHPSWHLHGALLQYAAEVRGDWNQYCFTGPALYGDSRSIDRTTFGKGLPKELYFLPDCQTSESLSPIWDSFLAALIQWAILEEGFSYLIYVGFGTEEKRIWRSKMSVGKKIIAYCPLPGGFSEQSPNDQWLKDALPAIDGSWGGQFIQKEAKALHLEEYLIVPAAVKEDFLQMTMFEKAAVDLSPGSLECVQMLCSYLPHK